jgi:hypothetical protein
MSTDIDVRERIVRLADHLGVAVELPDRDEDADRLARRLDAALKRRGQLAALPAGGTRILRR